MVEHYEDHGDDGHTDMQLTGYVFVPASGLELVYGRKQFAYCKNFRRTKWPCRFSEKGTPGMGLRASL